MHQRSVLGAACIVFIGCSSVGDSDPDEDIGTASEAVSQHCNDNADFEVDFLGCTEFAGVAVIPLANARAAVPQQYTPVDVGGGNGLLVVRVANCNDVEIDGHSIGGGTVAQVGVNIVAPEGDGDINNYTLYYDTDSHSLQKALKDAGVDARYDPNIDYDVNGTALSIDVPPPSKARYSVDGTISPQNVFAVPFTANWWAKDGSHTTKMNTVLPSIYFGGAATTLHADHNSPLPQLIGGDTLTFPALDSYNAFGDAHMVVDRR